MKLFILIILLASLPPLPVVRKFKKTPTTHQAQQLMFTTKSQVVIQPRIIVIPFRYPSNFNTNSRNWDLLGSSDFASWSIINPTNYILTNGTLSVLKDKPQMFYRVVSYQ